MVFSSTVFLCIFLPLVLLGYYICPKRGRNLFLLIASLVFYAWGEPKYVFLMIFSIIANYVFGLLMDKFRRNSRRLKLMLVLSVVVDLGLLGVFKYTDFIISNINAALGANFDLLKLALPIGISFYTFQAMSYTIDVYRGDVKVQRNIIDFGMYITMFPQLIAGPIVRYADVEEQLHERRVTAQDFSEGAMRFVVGLGKKVLLANQIGALWSEIYALGGSSSALMAWLGAIAFTFQIYFDFSGYSDMAIGLSNVFGFRFGENFNFPYLSKSVTEFWKRWHISLGSWFREYVYIPLGGSRRGSVYLNLFIVFLLTGMWHGNTGIYICWGLAYGILCVMERTPWFRRLQSRRWYPAVGWIYTMLVVFIGWLCFRLPDVGTFFLYLKNMLGMGIGELTFTYRYFFTAKTVTLLLVSVLGIFLCSRQRVRALYQQAMERPLWVYLKYIVLLALFALSYTAILSNGYTPFLYFQY